MRVEFWVEFEIIHAIFEVAGVLILKVCAALPCVILGWRLAFFCKI